MGFKQSIRTEGSAALSKQLASEFSLRTRERGYDYFTRGRVKIRDGSDAYLKAFVKGSENYSVNFEWEEGALFAQCDCPYFDSGGACKHLWAAILAAEAEGYLSKAAADRDLILEFDAAPDKDLDEREEQISRRSPHSPKIIPPPAPKFPAWHTQLMSLSAPGPDRATHPLKWPASRQILYVVEPDASEQARTLVLTPEAREAYADGAWKRAIYSQLRRDQIIQLPSLEDQQILLQLAGTTPDYGWGYGAATNRVFETVRVPDPLAERVLKLAAQAGRCYLRSGRREDQLFPLAWDDGEPWRMTLQVRRVPKGGWEVAGHLRRGEDRLNLKDGVLAVAGRFLFTRERIALLAESTPQEALLRLRASGPIHVPQKDFDNLLGVLLCTAGLPPPELPADVQYEEVTLRPRICLRIRPEEESRSTRERLLGDLVFDYDGREVSDQERVRGFYVVEERRFLRRDTATEEAAAQMLRDQGAKLQKPNYWDSKPAWAMAAGKLPRIVRALVEAGWHVEAEGVVFRRPRAFHMEVASGIDWFELHGRVDYDKGVAKLPELLEALRRGESMVRLDDGTYGILPEQWLSRLGLLAGLGTPAEGHLRFRPNQAGLLDALLASQPEACCDETFDHLRGELNHFQGIGPAPQPEGFVGQLRSYQCEGLGWMHFLRRFSFGGCLADDMGVGKTAQTLALLETRRALRAGGEPIPPSLVVVPRSLIFNWKQEAARFTPQLRVLDHTGLERQNNSFANYDVILTTYGTLRRDAPRLKDIEFDYAILDEAQAIKNASTEAAKAVRLLRAAHRLALSGTPVENHLGELWSLFEFLNPGMLGRASVFKLAGTSARNPDQETRRLLARALQPFILRRTKAQVAPELPPKTEQTIYCELEFTQRKLYDDLLRHYRATLLKRIEEEGLAKSKIQVLEALLRLRQAACHPGLIDQKRANDRSAKLDVLLEQLDEVLDEGHKALVFSQFTSLLAILRTHLEGKGTAYEYLDGATRDRQSPVERFQKEPDCRLFLVSLKAGGLGLNLTAAEYVFLLDPWWNPAVETQAIDRTHRIGQTRQVFAYRLIARDTVEEKVLELQKTKRDLADAIISADNSLIGNLRREDLELLLS